MRTETAAFTPCIVKRGATMRPRWYVGNQIGGGREAFTALTEPTEETHSSRYRAVWGPLWTKRGATFAALHSANNPHMVTIANAERIAKFYARKTERQ